MGLEQFLADTSAVIRILSSPELHEKWRTHTVSGLIAICPAVELELGLGTRSIDDHKNTTQALRETFGWIPMTDQVWDRAVEVQDSLIDMGAQGSASPIDLVIAATAERNRLTLLHCDKDFDCVARITEQRVMRVDLG
jgi:predicted nucleic acid-binding protein